MRNICKELRSEKGMTQEELAAKFNVTRQTIIRWEKDPDAIPINSYTKILILSHEGAI